MHCKGAGISPVIAGLDPGVTMEWVADRRAKSTGSRKPGAHPDQVRGRLFRDHALEHVPVPTESGHGVTHVLIGKPVPTFPGHAPGQRLAIRWISRAARPRT